MLNLEFRTPAIIGWQLELQLGLTVNDGPRLLRASKRGCTGPKGRGCVLGEELVDEAVPLLTTAIGAIMEDHAHDALQIEGAALPEKIEALLEAGSDIANLAAAAAVLLRRRAG